MQLLSITGATASGEVKSTKSIGALLFALDGLTVNQLTTESITAWVEKANGANIEIATQVLLKDFIALSTFGQEAVNATAVYETLALCEISDGDGAYMLNEGESLKFKLTGLDTTKTYVVFGVEDPASSMHLLKFDNKVVLSDVTTQKYDVSAYDLLAVADPAKVISEVTLYFSNGTSVKYAPLELKAMQLNIDPTPIVLQSGATADFSERLLIPLSGIEEDETVRVTAIDFVKASTNAVQLVFRAINPAF